MVAEWAMVAGLSAILFALTLQLVFALHVRNVLIDAASHGARYGTLADRGPADAQERTRELITGSVCGVKVQEVEDPLMRRIRYLDKLVDEVAKGKKMERILRS